MNNQYRAELKPVVIGQGCRGFLISKRIFPLDMDARYEVTIRKVE